VAELTIRTIGDPLGHSFPQVEILWEGYRNVDCGVLTLTITLTIAPQFAMGLWLWWPLAMAAPGYGGPSPLKAGGDNAEK